VTDEETDGVSPVDVGDDALLAEAKAMRLKGESFERALGRAIRRHCEGREAYKIYIRLISKHRERPD
jgi:hypothetical protein